MLRFCAIAIACLRHRVVSAFMPGMTFTKTSNSQKQTFNGSVAFESFYGVMGAGGLEATVVTQPWTQQILITPDGCDQQSYAQTV